MQYQTIFSGKIKKNKNEAVHDKTYNKNCVISKN